MADHGRTLILSDTHLGKRGPVTAESLATLWRGFDRVVFNGDTAEVQMPRHCKQAERELWHLRELAGRDQVELVLICGNHDAHVSDTHALSMLDGRVLVTHGHALHPGIAPWTSAGKPMAKMTHDHLAALPAQSAACLDTRLQVAQRVASEGFTLDPSTQREGGLGLRDMITHPWYAAKVLQYWFDAPRLASTFAERYCPEARVLVVGHSHRQGIWHRKGRTIINTGCYTFPSKPRAVVVERDTLAVHDVLLTPRGYVLSHSARWTKAVGRQGQGHDRLRERAA
ncbi:MAG: hypothetical protein ACIAXF_09135 [Phycisphaerales bacterium JB063]